MKRHQAARWLLLAMAVATFMVRPVSASASTSSEAPPARCASAMPTALTGTPVEISGPMPSNGAVAVVADRPDKRVREGTVTTANGAWRAVILFDASDAGSWTVHVSFDGAAGCESPMTVVLPAGVVAPPTQAAGATDAQPSTTEPTAGFDVADLGGLAVEAAAILVLGSWIFLAIVAVARLIGARPLSRRWLRAIAIPATFLAIAGGFLTVALLAAFMVSLGHFDTGTPPDQQALIDKAIWAMAALGAILGTLAALRVRNRTRHDAGSPR
jgi:hypothetical protein